ncbi:hypothetical protein MAR_029619, partial [Mya arenaria]
MIVSYPRCHGLVSQRGHFPMDPANGPRHWNLNITDSSPYNNPFASPVKPHLLVPLMAHLVVPVPLHAPRPADWTEKELLTSVDMPRELLPDYFDGGDIDCHMLFREVIPSGAYVDPFQLQEQRHFGGPDVKVVDPVDVEKPEVQSFEIVALVYANLTSDGYRGETVRQESLGCSSSDIILCDWSMIQLHQNNSFTYPFKL